VNITFETHFDPGHSRCSHQKPKSGAIQHEHLEKDGHTTQPAVTDSSRAVQKSDVIEAIQKQHAPAQQAKQKASQGQQAKNTLVRILRRHQHIEEPGHGQRNLQHAAGGEEKRLDANDAETLLDGHQLGNASHNVGKVPAAVHHVVQHVQQVVQVDGARQGEQVGLQALAGAENFQTQAGADDVNHVQNHCHQVAGGQF